MGLNVLGLRSELCFFKSNKFFLRVGVGGEGESWIVIGLGEFFEA